MLFCIGQAEIGKDVPRTGFLLKSLSLLHSSPHCATNLPERYVHFGVAARKPRRPPLSLFLRDAAGPRAMPNSSAPQWRFCGPLNSADINVLIGREQQLEALAFGLRQKLTVGDPVPATLYRLSHLVADKRFRDAARSPVVKENAHQSKRTRPPEPAEHQDCGPQTPAPPESAHASHGTVR